MSLLTASAEQLEPWLTVSAVVWGLLWGSFLNVVIHRVPQRQSVVRPASHCPRCGQALAWYENVPLLGFLFLRGRCRHCGASIAPRYVLVEALSGLLAALLWWHVSVEPRGDALWTQGALVFILQFYLLGGLIALSAIDLEHRLLPHRLTIPLAGLGLFTAWAAPADGVWASYSSIPSLADAVAGALCGMFLIWAVFHIFLRVTGKVGIGGGDMFLLGAIGAWFGWQSLPVVLLLASLQGILAVVVSFPVEAARRRRQERRLRSSGATAERDRRPTPSPIVESGNADVRALRNVLDGDDDDDDDRDAAEGDALNRDGIAFGPFLALAATEYLFFGAPLWRWFTGGSIGL